MAVPARLTAATEEPVSTPTSHIPRAAERPAARSDGPSVTPKRQPARRWAAVALLGLVVAAVALLVGRGGETEYRVVFDNAGQLVKGDVVRIGGTPAGLVEAVELTDDSRAAVRISVRDDFAPLHVGTTATIRAQGLVGVASRYVDVSPAPNFRRELNDGGEIGGEDTSSIVEIDQLFDAFDAKTRNGLAGVINGGASWYDGRERLANLSAQAFPAALESLSGLAADITADSVAFEQFLVQTGDAMGALAKRRQELTSLVSNARSTARALSADQDSLSLALRELPPALRQGSKVLAALRPAIGDLRRLVDASGPATKNLAPFLAELRPVLNQATPTFRQLRAMFAQPGAENDLLDALRDLPPLATLTSQTFPRARKALKDSTPVLQYVRPYTPDLVSWVRSFGGAAAPYDANGHYVRTLPVFDAFTFIDDEKGGHLVPKVPADRGRGKALSTGNLLRCPGTAAPFVEDFSAPFLDAGDQANPDCDPSQRVGGTR
jgi:phospholipid/cholesterol/gamma-HCH transport system substrate-binding protein